MFSIRREIRDRRNLESSLFTAAETDSLLFFEMGVREYGRRNISALRNSDGDTLLHVASRGGHINVIDQILEFGGNREPIINIDEQNRDGDTPLHIVSRSGYTSAVGNLVRRGARLDIRNNAGQTPLDVAANFDCRSVLQDAQAAREAAVPGF